MYYRLLWTSGRKRAADVLINLTTKNMEANITGQKRGYNKHTLSERLMSAKKESLVGRSFSKNAIHINVAEHTFDKLVTRVVSKH